jgi:Ca-activated chloride channel family protein
MKLQIAILTILFCTSGMGQIQDQIDNVIHDHSLFPEQVKFQSGRKGWKLQLLGNRPIATVAYADGLVFVGGGYGSYEFYAIDASSGKVQWMYRTGDDGPTAAIVKKGYVIFNTESCIIYILKAKTGEKVWEKWLGDPLMSQPAADDENVYMAYPGSDGSHRLACMRLRDGSPVWDSRIAGDIISAPIIYKEAIYITCFNGTVYRYDKKTGKLIWAQEKNATCAPTLFDNRVFLSLRQEQKTLKDSVKQYEGIASLEIAKGIQEQRELWAMRAAPYLVYGRTTAKVSEQSSLDASVGFGSAPGTAKLDQAKMNVGQYSVVGCWAYQGSKPVIRNNRAYNAMGDEIRTLDTKTGHIVWSKKFDLTEENIGGRVFSPPALVNQKLFLGAGNGDVYCIDARDGEMLWKESVAGSVSFQPAIAKGILFVSTDNGTLYGIETGNRNDDGWYMWGGNAEHNM